MSYLHGYIYNGDTIGTDIIIWSVENLSGNPAFVANISASNISGYEDISSLETWDTYYTETDFLVSEVRQEIEDLVTAAGGFSNLSTGDKEIASRWFVVEKSDRDTVYSDEEQNQHALELASLLLEENLDSSLDSLIATLTNDEDVQNAIFSTYELFYNSVQISWQNYDPTNIKLNAFSRSNSLYTVNASGDGILLEEDGEYSLTADISLLCNQQNVGAEAWIAVNGIEAAGTRGHFFITSEAGQTSSIQDVIGLSQGDEVTIVVEKSASSSQNRTLIQPINGTRLLIRKN